MTFIPFSRIQILFSCPGPLLAPIWTLPKLKLIKWSYLSITLFWNSLPRILLLVPAYPLILLLPRKVLPNCCSADISDPVSYLPQCFLCAVLSVFFLFPFTLFSLFCMAHIYARNIQNQYSVIIPSVPNHQLFYCELTFDNCRSVMALPCIYGVSEKCARLRVNKKKEKKKVSCAASSHIEVLTSQGCAPQRTFCKRL